MTKEAAQSKSTHFKSAYQSVGQSQLGLKVRAIGPPVQQANYNHLNVNNYNQACVKSVVSY